MRRLIPFLTLGLVIACGNSIQSSHAPGAGAQPHDPTSNATEEEHALGPVPGEGIFVDVGMQEVLLPGEALGLTYFPDMATIRLSSEPERLLVVAKHSTFLVSGPTLRTLDTAVEVLAPTPWDGEGELPIDNGYAGISGVYRDNQGLLYGYYHAEDQVNLPTIGDTGIPGFHASIGLATSIDDGLTWTKQGAVVTSSQPKGLEEYPGQADFGAAEPGTVVGPNGAFLYLYYTEHSRREGRGVQTCVARAPLDPVTGVPGQFIKYHQGDFSEPGLGGLDTPIITGTAFNNADAVFPHPVYSPELGQYVMVLSIFDWDSALFHNEVGQSGIYIAYSYDAVHWSTPQILVSDYSIVVAGRSLSWEANILWDNESIGTEGWLIYGYSERWGFAHNGDVPHYMAGRRLSLTR